jgi:hypothetical protein
LTNKSFSPEKTERNEKLLTTKPTNEAINDPEMTPVVGAKFTFTVCGSWKESVQLVQ